MTTLLLCLCMKTFLHCILLLELDLPLLCHTLFSQTYGVNLDSTCRATCRYSLFQDMPSTGSKNELTVLIDRDFDGGESRCHVSGLITIIDKI